MLYLGLLVRFIGEEKDKNGETVLYIAVVTIIVLSLGTQIVKVIIGALIIPQRLLAQETPTRLMPK